VSASADADRPRPVEHERQSPFAERSAFGGFDRRTAEQMTRYLIQRESPAVYGGRESRALR